MAQALEQVGAPLGEVHDPRRHPVGVQATRMTLAGGASSSGATPSVSSAMRAVRGDHLPPAIDHRRRVRLVAAQHELERLAHRAHVGVVERPLAVERGVAGREQELVAIAQRDLELLGELQHHLGAGRERPVSTKLTWRADTPASSARSSWLSRRRWRQSRSSGPTPGVCLPSHRGDDSAAAGTAPTPQVIDARDLRVATVAAVQPNPEGDEMTEVTTVVDGYIAMWNETDPERRRSIIEQTWTDDGSYVDPHAEVDGHRRPRRARRRPSRSSSPATASCSPTAPTPTTTACASPGSSSATSGDAIATGMDVGVVADDGRLRAVTGFLEAA